MILATVLMSLWLNSYELEALSIGNSVERFGLYLIIIIINSVITDCYSFKLLENKKDFNPWVGRWFMRLGVFNYTVCTLISTS